MLRIPSAEVLLALSTARAETDIAILGDIL